MFMQAKSSIHTWIWNDAAIKPASAACGIAEPHWPTISQTSESRLTDCQNNLKVKSAAACSIQSCNHLDNVSFGGIQTAFPEDLRSADVVWAHAMHDVRRPTLSSSTSAGENGQATCARTLGTAAPKKGQWKKRLLAILGAISLELLPQKYVHTSCNPNLNRTIIATSQMTWLSRAGHTSQISH